MILPCTPNYFNGKGNIFQFVCNSFSNQLFINLRLKVLEDVYKRMLRMFTIDVGRNMSDVEGNALKFN
jgi:hypothetical protein